MAASEPARPEQPRYITSTSDSITLAFDKVQDNGGATISSYELYVNLNGEFTPLTNYDGKSLQWTITQIDEPLLLTGETYEFKVSAVNEIGESELSNYVTIAMAELAA